MERQKNTSPQFDEVIHATKISGEEFVLTRDLSLTDSDSDTCQYQDLPKGKHLIVHQRPDVYADAPAPTGKLSNWSYPYASYSPVPAMHKDIDLRPSSEETSELKDNYTNKSFEAPLTFDAQGRPENPIGRTGLDGKGKLFNWGPNNAADPVLIHQSTEKQLEVLLIKRADGAWAFPGGFADPQEDSKAAAFRELCEEAVENGHLLQDAFMKGSALIFEGYTADGRNTDNAWIETSVHALTIGSELKDQLKIKARDDAMDVAWKPVTQELLDNLYSDHGRILSLISGQKTKN